MRGDNIYYLVNCEWWLWILLSQSLVYFVRIYSNFLGDDLFFNDQNKGHITSIHKINHDSLVPNKILTAFELWVFLTQEKKQKKDAERFMILFVARFLTFWVINNGLHNFPGLWKISNSFCAYFGLTWFSPQKDQRDYPYGERTIM